MIAGVTPIRYKLPDASDGMAMATDVQTASVEATHHPARDRVKQPGLDTNPVGWFSDRRRIRANSGIRVARFQVWQDLSATSESDIAPLHATIMFELSNEWYLGLSKPNGVIRIENAKGEKIMEAGFMLHHVNFGLESTSKKQLQFAMSPMPLYKKLNTSETVRGFAQMKFWNRKVTMILPETNVLSIR